MNGTLSKDTEASLEKRKNSTKPNKFFLEQVIGIFYDLHLLSLPVKSVPEEISLPVGQVHTVLSKHISFFHTSFSTFNDIFNFQSIWGQIWYNPLFCIPGHYARYSKKIVHLQELFSWFDLSKVLKST